MATGHVGAEWENTLNIHENQQGAGDNTSSSSPVHGWEDHLPLGHLSILRVDQLNTHPNLKAISKECLPPEPDLEYNWDLLDGCVLSNTPTWILPRISLESPGPPTIFSGRQDPVAALVKNQAAELRKLIKSSAIYALYSLVSPLISLVIAPFLTHNLSPSDYAILTITNTAIGLTSGITQLGLGSAFFRAYGYDYTLQKDRHDIVATATALLCLISIPTAIILAMIAPTLANLFFGRSSLGNYISLAGGVVALQNLIVPGLTWLRAENRALFYSLLSISSLFVTLFTNIILVGMLRYGVTGSIIATGSGYACIVICTLPVIVLRAGIKIRVDIARNLLSFGLPLVLNFVSYWVLQLSDRYLLSLFASLTETARYAVTYTLGSAMAVVVMGPFTLAWPATVFAIARRKDAAQIFKLVFRWFSLFLLFAAFCLSLVGIELLNWLFPVTYRSAAFVIPVVAESMAFYGIYNIFKSGLDVIRKTWLISIYTTVAALVNIALNLVLIPHYGSMGAAVATLFAYIVLATIAYIVNQRIYPIPFEIHLFIIALFIGIALYVGSDFLAQVQGTYIAVGIRVCALALYGGCLIVLGMLSNRFQ